MKLKINDYTIYEDCIECHIRDASTGQSRFMDIPCKYWDYEMCYSQEAAIEYAEQHWDDEDE